MPITGGIKFLKKNARQVRNRYQRTINELELTLEDIRKKSTVNISEQTAELVEKILINKGLIAEPMIVKQ